MITFFREERQSLHRTAWVIGLPVSTLSDWNQDFDSNMNPIVVPDNRGKSCKVTIEIVRQVIQEAEKWKGKRIRLKSFTRKLSEKGVNLSAKTVSDILIANDLRAPQTRKRRPRFYQSLRRQIPNGLIAFDGGRFTVWCGNEPFAFNLELSVDVRTFAHTAFSIGDTETTDEIINTLESHIEKWGCPVGILCDHGSANCSDMTKQYVKNLGIEFVPVGPGNPKGNGSLEGAFSQMKSVLGTISLDMSSPKALAGSVLELLVKTYITMRNKLPLRREFGAPAKNLAAPVSEHKRNAQRQHLKNHNAAKKIQSEDQSKIERLRFFVQTNGIKVDEDAMKWAEKVIVAYETAVIIESESAFIKAVNRKPEKSSLPYFFGILKNKQQQRDDAVYKEYCRKKYHHDQMIENQRRIEEQQKGAEPPSIELILDMLEKGINATSRVIRRVGFKNAQEWTRKLMKNYRYPGALKNKFADALGQLKHLSIELKEKMWNYILEFLNPKTAEECVTLF